MEVIKSNIEGLLLFKPQVFSDNRGAFFEAYKEPVFESEGIKVRFCQDNISTTAKGVIRGIHYQTEPFAQGKLVRCVRGSIFDVAVDLRKNSLTYGKWESFELTSQNNNSLYVPPGFGHAFQALGDNTTVYYKCTALYSKDHEKGIRFDDTDLNIDWPLDVVGISDKDKDLKLFKDL